MPSDFFSAPDLPRPEVSAAEAERVAAEAWGLTGTATELGSQQDRNFRVDTGTGRYVLKLSNPAFSPEELEAQSAVLTWLEAKRGPGKGPAVVLDTQGRALTPLTVEGGDLFGRMLSYLEGAEMSYTPAAVAGLGRLAGETVAALDGFDHPGLDRTLQWDLRHAERVVDLLLPYVSGTDQAERVRLAMAGAAAHLAPLAAELPVQVIHGDLTDDNVLCDRDRAGHLVPGAVIDFGDIVRSWRIGELAVACASLLHRSPGDPSVVLPAVSAFASVVPLTEAEIDAFWPLVVARAAVLVVSEAQQLSIDPGNDYAAEGLVKDSAGLAGAIAVPIEVMTAAVRHVLDRPAPSPPVRPHSRLLPTLGPVQIVDLSATSPVLDEGRWLTTAATALLEAAGPGAAARYGEYRLAGTAPESQEAPASYALHVALVPSPGEPVAAPFAGRLVVDGDRTALAGEELTLLLGGVAPATAGDVDAGATIGTTTAAPLTVQLCTLPGVRPPLLTTAALAPGWRAVCPDPSALVGLVAAPEPAAEALLARRDAHLARVQEHYYATPPEIERGWRHYLVDVHGRAYVDMINNVTLLGHAHPRLVEAMERQARRLNTNSRFHYGAVAELAERVTALAPAPLNAVFFVNSGSEAADLAIRLATIATGRKDVVCVQEAYHGWTMASDAVSTSTADNPNALTTRPSWVHPVPAPNTYRGTYRGSDEGGQYADDAVAAIGEIAARGNLGGFIAEAYYGNAGGMALPAGYLRDVYAAVRAGGGLCIADEVQVGYGRLGEYFWGFEQQDVVPDIIAVAKGMGSGHPIGAVITTQEIADTFSREGYFFSSTGASPVSCKVGLAVLDVMADEGLQANARAIGARLRSRLEALAARHEIIGAVHGMGLYMGVELVRDRTTLEPAAADTSAICQRLLDLGVICQPTADLQNVLKVKPPLCITAESADFFVATLDRVLTEGW